MDSFPSFLFQQELKKHLDQQFQQLVQMQKEQEKIFNEIWESLLQETEDMLATKLKNPEPLIRWAAIHAIVKK